MTLLYAPHADMHMIFYGDKKLQCHGHQALVSKVQDCLLSRPSGVWRSWKWRARSVACVPRRQLRNTRWQHGGRSAYRKRSPPSCSHWMLPGATTVHVLLGTRATLLHILRLPAHGHCARDACCLVSCIRRAAAAGQPRVEELAASEASLATELQAMKETLLGSGRDLSSVAALKVFDRSCVWVAR